MLYPFGFGLSYTKFEVRLLSAAETADGITAFAAVQNTGSCSGKEVVQLYVADCTGTTGRPPKELRKFVKVKLEPGEEKQVEFTLTAQDLSTMTKRWAAGTPPQASTRFYWAIPAGISTHRSACGSAPRAAARS